MNTGVFVGYVQSSSAPVTQYDGILTLGEESNVTVQYTDQFDPTDVSTGGSLVDPFGVVFSSNDGALLDGAIVSILDSSGSPANVFGDDGVSTYPNTVVTGGSATDSGGTIVNFPAGGYRFPRLAPGDYQLVVIAPSGFEGPSTVSAANLQLLPGAPYSLDTDASFASVFTLQAGPPLHVDIPLDALTSILVINKAASKDTAAIGDFVQYTLTLDNVDTNPAGSADNVVITDVLPVGCVIKMVRFVLMVWQEITQR